MTPEAAVLAALNTHAAALPSNFPPLVFRSDQDALPEEYIMAEQIRNRSTAPYVGDTRQDLMGIYQLTLAKRPGDHEIVYLEQAAQIVAHFVGACRLTHDGVIVEITDGTAGTGRADGTRWAIPVSIYYKSLA
jgi:hypothetical protein